MTEHGPSAGDYRPIFRFGNFTFDCASRLLLRDGVQLHLSPKAQQLLRRLLIARPCAVSREELYDSLWPETFVSETNLAGVVNEVRRALADDPRAPQYLRTVHGFGYAFCGDATASQLVASVSAFLLCEGRAHLLQEGENMIGRAVGVPVMLANPSVSRFHARITLRGGEIWLEDLGSKNGTYVNGEAVQAVRLSGDELLDFGGVAATLTIRSASATDSLKIDIRDVKRRIAEQTGVF